MCSPCWRFRVINSCYGSGFFSPLAPITLLSWVPSQLNRPASLRSWLLTPCLGSVFFYRYSSHTGRYGKINLQLKSPTYRSYFISRKARTIAFLQRSFFFLFPRVPSSTADGGTAPFTNDSSTVPRATLPTPRPRHFLSASSLSGERRDIKVILFYFFELILGDGVASRVCLRCRSYSTVYWQLRDDCRIIVQMSTTVVSTSIHSTVNTIQWRRKILSLVYYEK